MRVSPPALAPYLRSDAQARILALILLHPDESFTLAEVARRTGIVESVVHKEITRLVEGEVLTDTRVGRARQVSANPGYALAEPLAQIITTTYGPVPVLTAALRGIEGIESAYIYGSWAARSEGVHGSVPHDIDVLVIGDASRAHLNTAAADAEDKLGLPVNIKKLTPSAWAGNTEPFVRTVKSRPLINLVLEKP